MDPNREDEIKRRRQEWEENTLGPALARFGLAESPTQFFTPLDIRGFDFLEQVGFPGEYPFTSGAYPTHVLKTGERGAGWVPQAPGLVRAGQYSGYGTAEEMRDYFRMMQSIGQRSGPNIAFDLPSQCGYDSDAPEAKGEVGRVGLAISSLRDIEVLYEAFVGDMDIDKVASNFTINAPANIIMAMYCALAKKRGISLVNIRATPQNDILKEFFARGTYIWPPRPSMRLFRDSITFFTKYLPQVNIVSVGCSHMRAGGATRIQGLAWAMSTAIAYLKCGTDAGLDIDSFAPRVSFNSLGGSMEFFPEIAMQRAARRIWAKILRDKFGAKNPRSMLLRQAFGGRIDFADTTVQRPLNNLTRAVIGGVAGALSGSVPVVSPPYDEPLGLGWSREACQLQEDAERILQVEAKLGQVIDPLAGSYFIEHLTDQVEESAWSEINKIDKMGGAVVAVENGYLHREIARSAWEHQRQIESGERQVVGLNSYTGEHELEVTTTRLVPYPYDPVKREEAEEKQKANLAALKQSRDNREVSRLLNELISAAKQEQTDLMPHFIECAGAYVTLQEMCDALRGLWGEYQRPQI